MPNGQAMGVLVLVIIERAKIDLHHADSFKEASAAKGVTMNPMDILISMFAPHVLLLARI